MGLYWADREITSMSDEELVSLINVLELNVRHNTRVITSPELESQMGQRLAACLAEVDARLNQFRLF